MFHQKILIATDFSSASTPAIETGAQLARRFGAEVVLLYVYDPALLSPLYLLPGGAAIAPGDTTADAFEEGVRKDMDRLVAQHLGGIEGVQTLIRQHPSTPDGICTSARELGADLVVIGTHGRTGFKHALIGSVAERVVRHAPCPVLTVRQPTPATPGSH